MEKGTEMAAPSEVRTLGAELNELIRRKSGLESDLRRINKKIEEKRKELSVALQKGEVQQ